MSDLQRLGVGPGTHTAVDGHIAKSTQRAQAGLDALGFSFLEVKKSVVRIQEALAEKGDVMEYTMYFKKKVFELQNALHFENTNVLKIMRT